MSQHLFISYSKQDVDFARYLRALLEAEGFAVWMDEARLHPGEEWWDSILANIDQAAALLVIMSPVGQGSKWVQREILYAEKVERPIFPILLAGDIWPRLADIQFEDMRAGLRAKLSKSFAATLHEIITPAERPPREIIFTIQHGDILKWDCDVAVFKYSGLFRGADALAAEQLISHGIPEEALTAAHGEYKFTDTRDALYAAHVLYIGMPVLRHMGYKHIREIGAQTLNILSQIAPEIRHVAMTIHGPGFGLDETEAMLSQFAGIKDSLDAGLLPSKLERVTIVEFHDDRVERLQHLMTPLLDEADYAHPIPMEESADGWGYALRVHENENAGKSTSGLIESAGTKAKTHAYVAMPSGESMDDVFYYGIQTPIHMLGLLCERMDGSSTGDEMIAQARTRIDGAAVVVAEVSTPDPHVYLQIGYAWGRNCPVILLAKDGVRFANEACLHYDKIRDLERALLNTLETLKADGKF